MKLPLLFTFFFLSLMTGFAQNGRLAGIVADSLNKTVLESATVSIFNKDSSLINYQLSDKNGKFTFEKLPLKKELLVNITYVGYNSWNKNITLDGVKLDTLSAFLSLNLNDTNAVVVSAIIPVRMNGDTLEINPAAFKMKPDAVVEELLNQVPGVTIWSDGSITVNGKKVQNLFVDGKPFLGSSDARIATQNLPKSAIDKIQLYQEYDRSYVGKDTKPKDSLLTMNIKLKEDSKKGYFGKASVGYGTDRRYESDLSFQMYNKRSSIGIGGGLNNINKNIENLQELFQNNTYRNYNPNLYDVGRFGTNGINKNYSIGGAFTHSFIETSNSRQNNRVAVNYNRSGTDSYLTDLSLQNRTTVDNPQFIREEGIQNNQSTKNNLGINYVKTNSYNDNLTVNGSVNTNNESGNSSRFTEVRDSASQLQSTNTNITFQNKKSANESLNLDFAKSDPDNPLKNFNIQYNINNNQSNSEREVKSDFNSYTENGKDTSYNRRYHNDNNGFSTGATLEYTGFKRLLLGRYNLLGINMNLGQWFNYAQSADDNRVMDFDSSLNNFVINNSISNHNKNQVFEYSPYLSFSKDFSKPALESYRSLGIRARVFDDIKQEKNQSSIPSRNLNRQYQFVRYEGDISYQKYFHERFNYYTNISYKRNFNYPSIDQLYPVLDDINAYYIRIGNPNLKNRVNQYVNFYGSFNTQNPKSLYAVNGSINGSYTFTSNPITDSIINEKSGRRTYYSVNVDKSNNWNLNYNFNISRKLNKNNIQLMYNGYVNRGALPNYIDNVYTDSRNSSLSNQFKLQFSLRSLLILNIGETIQNYKTRQTGSGLTSFRNANNITKFGITLNYPDNFTISSSMYHINNSNLEQPTILWNAFATYRFMKQQGELKFTAMDLLKQYQNITNSVNTYGTTTRIANGLQQYFLLTFSYYPRKFGKTEVKKKSNEVSW